MGRADEFQLGGNLLCATEVKGDDGRGRHEERVAVAVAPTQMKTDC